MDIVWIHGFPLSSRVFDRQRAVRGANHLMFDLPGFGEAPPNMEEQSMTTYARSALAQAEGAAIFAGVSMGGYICFEVARLAPERVLGLILLDTRETADSEEAKKGRYASIDKVRQEGTRPIVESMLPKMVAGDAEVDNVRRIMSAAAPDGVIAALQAMAERPDSTSLLPTLTIPVLIIVGESDAITPPADSERMASLLPNARLVRIAGAAHLANLEKSDEVNAAIEQWLKDEFPSAT